VELQQPRVCIPIASFPQTSQVCFMGSSEAIAAYTPHLSWLCLKNILSSVEITQCFSVPLIASLQVVLTRIGRDLFFAVSWIVLDNAGMRGSASSPYPSSNKYCPVEQYSQFGS
jgi:hypothetical protein